MATINTAEDILRALQDDPELLRQVRRAILTDDLLALPSQSLASYARTVARKDAIGIAMALDDVHRWGIQELEVEALSPSQILALAGRYGSDNLATIPRNMRRSFYLSDLIIKVPKLNGDVCYITAEASYTCDDRDTGRAIAHANLLTQMTGEEAWPAVVGVRLDQRIESIVENGNVLWYPLDERDMNP